MHPHNKPVNRTPYPLAAPVTGSVQPTACGSQEVTLGECVKCGHRNPVGAAACTRCTWPFSRDTWKTSKLRIRRVTLDTGALNAKGRDPDLNTLERWARWGYLELQRSQAMLGELAGEARVEKAQSLDAHPCPHTLDSSVLDGPDVLAGPDLPEALQQILFPTANPLTENQRYDVQHLRLHVRTVADVFVTLNPNDFITRGRQ